MPKRKNMVTSWDFLGMKAGGKVTASSGKIYLPLSYVEMTRTGSGPPGRAVERVFRWCRAPHSPQRFRLRVAGDVLSLPRSVPTVHILLYPLRNALAVSALFRSAGTRVADPVGSGPFWSEPEPENFHRIRILSLPILAM